MAVIKISKKQALDDLQSRLILRVGRKLTQQETLDLCVRFANSRFEDLVGMVSSVPVLSPDKAQKILTRIEKYKDTYYNPNETFANQNDQDAYSV